MSDWTDRLDAKRFNAFVTLLSSSLASLAVGIALGAAIVPFVTQGASPREFHVLWLTGAGILYVCCLIMTQFLVSEE